MFQGRDSCGDDVTQSPIWVRPDSLQEDMLQPYRHIIGHTEQYSITFSINLILIDALAHRQYLIIEDNEIRIGKLK